MLAANEAHRRASEGELLLIDIRSPQEWMQTGIGEGALAITMHRNDFLDRLLEAVDGNRNRAIALICATGNRSRWLQFQLNSYGFAAVEDVSEGMLGSAAGPGWLNRGLPTATPR